MSDLVDRDPLALRPLRSQSSGTIPLLRILCVDDEPHALSALSRLLSHDFDVVTRQNPVDGLALLEQDGNFAVVIADVNMPQMNGLTFLKRVQAISPTTTRLAITGSFVVNPVDVPREAVFRVISKPCPPQLLKEIVLDAANYHALLAASPVQPIERRYQTPMVLPPDDPVADRQGQLLSRHGLLDLTHVLTHPVILRDGDAAISFHGFPVRLGLRMTGRSVELLPGLTLVGRSRTCHIPIDDPLVSRRHACFSNEGHALTVKNLSSTNGLLLNGVTVLGEEPQLLQVGDQISIGSHQIEVCAFGDYSPSLEPTQLRAKLPIRAEVTQAPEATATLGKLAEIASKYMRLDQSRDAERIVRPGLEGLLRFCRSGQKPLLDDVSLALYLALGIAASNRTGEWVSYVFELLSCLELAAEPEILERLYHIVPSTPGISMASYRTYLETLAKLQERWSPAQRFLIRRVLGLETAIMMSAHV